ncbi:hypothetical protein ACFV2H_23025 [Streptomyces sp. NPDC059629]|uniref:hypothetical protein n=1 Tax=Streptomyces sp. NPDC059629 TaxID=3346889 RepID=UPI0036A13176
MRAIRVASAALLGVGTLALCAPAILANDGDDGGRDSGRKSASLGFLVTPSTVAAGGRVSLHLNRDDSCRGAATVSSGLFDTVRIPAGQDSGTATVNREVRSQASYRVTFNCDGASASTELAVSDGNGAARSDGAGGGRTDGNGAGRTDDQTGGRTDQTAGRTDQTAGRTDGRTDAGAGGRTGSGTDARTDGRTHAGSGDHTGGRTDGGTDSGTDSGAELNPQPLPPSHGVQAGAGGSFGGFDLKEIGLGAALVVGSVGAAYRIARRHTGEAGS